MNLNSNSIKQIQHLKLFYPILRIMWRRATTCSIVWLPQETETHIPINIIAPPTIVLRLIGSLIQYHERTGTIKKAKPTNG